MATDFFSLFVWKSSNIKLPSTSLFQLNTRDLQLDSLYVFFHKSTNLKKKYYFQIGHKSSEKQTFTEATMHLAALDKKQYCFTLLFYFIIANLRAKHCVVAVPIEVLSNHSQITSFDISMYEITPGNIDYIHISTVWLQVK